MTRALLLSIILGTLVVWDAAAQQLMPRPGFTEKHDRVVCGRMGCEAKTFSHDRAVAGFRLEALSACPVPSKLSVARRRKRRCTTEARPSKYTSLGRILAGRSLDHGGCPSVVLTAGRPTEPPSRASRSPSRTINSTSMQGAIGLSAVSKNAFDEREEGTIAVLNFGGMNDNVQQETMCRLRTCPRHSRKDQAKTPFLTALAIDGAGSSADTFHSTRSISNDC